MTEEISESVKGLWWVLSRIREPEQEAGLNELLSFSQRGLIADAVNAAILARTNTAEAGWRPQVRSPLCSESLGEPLGG